MTGDEALALALLGYRKRPLVGALTRILLDRPVDADAAVPPRAAGEPLLAWTARVLGLHDQGAIAAGWLEEAARTRARSARAGHAIVALGELAYPAPLAQIPDPPPVLFVRGSVEALARPAVALVGARAATAYGKEMARALAADLAARDVVVVSGLARGIDGAAHQAALDAGGLTVAVLGAGLDRIYPAEHEALGAAAVAAGGALVGELRPGTPPLAHHFPLRNRIISGLASAVVVVEAAEKSGSLITAACALEQGREVMAVPGPVRAGRHRGAHALLRDGATLVETADDILAELGWAAPRGAGDRRPGLDPAVASALGLPPETVEFTVDDVAGLTGLPAQVVLGRLLALEIDGRIQRIGSGRYSGVRANVTRSET
jgi:DNA processing protein